jgi:hypothetical protein
MIMNSQTLLHLIHLASTYGSGAYSSGTYGGSSVTIGPITLPVTGAAAVAVGCAAILAIAGGLAVWQRQRRRKE